MIQFFVGMDIGDLSDHTAVVVVKYADAYLEAARRYEEHSDKLDKAYRMPRHYDRTDLRFMSDDNEALAEAIPVPAFEVVQAYRRPLRKGWADHAEHAKRLMSSPTLINRAQLCVDEAGVGGIFTQDLRTRSGLNLRAVTVSGSAQTEHKVLDDPNRPDSWVVPKRDLVNRPKLLLETQPRRLTFAQGLEFREVLQEELSSFQYRTTAAGNVTYGEWRSGKHDDLVFALGLALWDAERFGGSSTTNNPALSTTMGTHLRPEELEELPAWFLQAPEDGAVPAMEQDEPSIWGTVVQRPPTMNRPPTPSWRRDFPLYYPD